MKKLFVGSAIVFATSAISMSVYAQDQRDFKFVLTAGMSTGGDDIFELNFVDGSSRDIKAGGLFNIGAGLILQMPDMPWAGQLTINYQFDRVNAKNADVRFDRAPVEAMAFYTGLENWRFGAGVRLVQNPKAELSMDDADDIELEFENTTGLVLEVGYQVTPQLWVNLRSVSEDYQAETEKVNGVKYDARDLDEISGNHIGLNVLFQF